MRSLYRLLSIFTTAKAATRGPGALAGNIGRRTAHKALAKAMRPRRRR